jgi:hypothetical protein
MATTDIAQKLEFINDSFIASDVQTELTGKNASTVVTNNTKFLKSVLDYSQFEANIVPASGFYANAATINNIFVKKGNNNYTSVNYVEPAAGAAVTPQMQTGWQIPAANITNSEYNYSQLLSSWTVTAYGTSFSSSTGGGLTLLNILDKIRVAYNILEEKTFQDYRSRKQASVATISTPVLKYSIQTTGSTRTSLSMSNIVEIEDLVRPIIDIAKVDLSTTRIEMVRRILYLYDALIHIYIGFYLLSLTSVNTNIRIPLYDITYDSIKMFFARNDIIEDVGSNIATIQKDMQKRIISYHQNKESIEKHATKLKENKTDIRIQKDRLSIVKSYEKKTSVLYYIYLIIMLVGIISITSIMFSQTLAPGIKRLIVGILASISIVAMVILYLVNRYTLESFAGAITLTGALSSTAIKASSDLISVRTNLLEEVSKAVHQYLTNTVNIGLLINTYNSYGEMNYSIQKENKFYQDKNDVLDQNKNQLVNASNVIDLENKVRRYRVYYFVQLLITISVVSILVVYLPETSSIISLLLIITSLIIILFTYIYIVNVNNLVRTDASKLYWGQPDPKEFLY